MSGDKTDAADEPEQVAGNGLLAVVVTLHLIFVFLIPTCKQKNLTLN